MCRRRRSDDCLLTISHTASNTSCSVRYGSAYLRSTSLADATRLSFDSTRLNSTLCRTRARSQYARRARFVPLRAISSIEYRAPQYPYRHRQPDMQIDTHISPLHLIHKKATQRRARWRARSGARSKTAHTAYRWDVTRGGRLCHDRRVHRFRSQNAITSQQATPPRPLPFRS